MKVDRASLPRGWSWVTEGEGFMNEVFGFIDFWGKRCIGLENSILRGPNRERVKGIWNSIRAVDDKGGEQQMLWGTIEKGEFIGLGG